MKNQKIYKLQDINDINMLPGDRNGSPDDCFYSFLDALRGEIAK